MSELGWQAWTVRFAQAVDRRRARPPRSDALSEWLAVFWEGYRRQAGRDSEAMTTDLPQDEVRREPRQEQAPTTIGVHRAEQVRDQGRPDDRELGR